jgi:branched-chain amino acid transport system substrate-binding protein
LIVADTAGLPAQTLTKARELIERDKVDVLIGPLAAGEALAVNDYINQAGVPTIIPAAAAEDLTQRKAGPWLVRVSGTSAQFAYPLADYAATELKYKRIATIADDLAYGHEVMGGFMRVFEESGGKVVQKLWSPFNAADYGTYIAQVKGDVDALLVGLAGQNGPKFLRQWSEFGFKGKIPLLGTLTTTDESLLRVMGDEAVGIISSGPYCSTIDNPVNKKFVDDVVKATGQIPGYYVSNPYTAGAAIEQALISLKGNIDDRTAFMKAVRAVKLESDPRGNFEFDQYGNAICDMRVFRVTKGADGKLRNEIIKTYPHVSQFWNYDPAQFLKNPVYSRDYPPAKNLE